MKYCPPTDGIKYWIEIDNEKGKDKILIDETTGVISVTQGHGFDIGDKFKISVFVANTYLPEGKKLAELNLTITKYYKPLVDGLVFYEDTEVEQTDAFSITPRELEGYEEVSFNLLGNWKHLLSMTEDGTIQAEEGNNIAVGTSWKIICPRTKPCKNSPLLSFHLSFAISTAYFAFVELFT